MHVVRRHHANHLGLIGGGTKHRAMISLSFGPPNCFSEAFDRGFAMRGKMATANLSFCARERAHVERAISGVAWLAKSALLPDNHRWLS